MSMFKTIESYIKDEVGYLYLNQPHSLNALTLPMSEEISMCLDEFRSHAVRCVVLSGRGRFFSSGQNLKPSKENPQKPTMAVLEEYYHPMMMRFKELDCPLITALNGPAVGFSVGMALMGDMIIAKEGSYVMLPFSKIGLVPDGGATFILARAFGRQRLMELIYTCEKVLPEELLQLGLINGVYEQNEFENALDKLVNTLAEGPKHAYTLSRQLIWKAYDKSYAEQIDAECAAQIQAYQHEEMTIGVRAFLEKKAPKFKKKPS